MAPCHGAIAQIAPQARVIDVTHDVPPGDVTRGAAVLAQTVRYLPPAVHVAVVDPGVGTARRGIAIAHARRAPGRAGQRPAALGGGRARRRRRRRSSCATAGWLAPAVSPHVPRPRRLRAGRRPARRAAPTSPTPARRSTRRPWSACPTRWSTSGDGWLEAEVLTVDRFGNVQLAAVAPTLAGFGTNLRVGGEPAVRGRDVRRRAAGRAGRARRLGRPGGGRGQRRQRGRTLLSRRARRRASRRRHTVRQD